MLTIQPPFTREYFTWNQVKLASSNSNKVFNSHYLSWEDALWHLILVYQIPKHGVVVLPEFFCGDVIDHMRAHELKIATYPVNEKLQTRLEDFLKVLKLYKPSVLIIFHPVGITNQLFSQASKWLSYVPSRCLIIEDSVHRVVDPNQLSFLTGYHHLVIDSLRKVVPLQGSNIYSLSPIPLLPITVNLQTFIYRYRVLWWWLKMQYYLYLANKCESLKLAKRYNLLAEQAMIRGYAVIGSIKFSSPGFKIMQWLSTHLNLAKIKNTKREQYYQYNEVVRKLLSNHPQFLCLDISPHDYLELRGYPLVITDLVLAKKFLNYFRDAGLIIRFELDDSPWSMRQKIVYLPMGLHVKTADINAYLACLDDFLTH